MFLCSVQAAAYTYMCTYKFINKHKYIYIYVDVNCNGARWLYTQSVGISTCFDHGEVTSVKCGRAISITVVARLRCRAICVEIGQKYK